jgi:hypothetical protein
MSTATGARRSIHSQSKAGNGGIWTRDIDESFHLNRVDPAGGMALKESFKRIGTKSKDQRVIVLLLLLKDNSDEGQY